MKYLKQYRIFESTMRELLSDVNDILLELSDSVFSFRIDEPKLTPVIFSPVKNNLGIFPAYRYYIINIIITRNGTGSFKLPTLIRNQDEFNIFKDVLLRLRDYMLLTGNDDLEVICFSSGSYPHNMRTDVYNFDDSLYYIEDYVEVKIRKKIWENEIFKNI